MISLRVTVTKAALACKGLKSQRGSAYQRQY
jgi:hypothetical protein